MDEEGCFGTFVLPIPWIRLEAWVDAWKGRAKCGGCRNVGTRGSTAAAECDETPSRMACGWKECR